MYIINRTQRHKNFKNLIKVKKRYDNLNGKRYICITTNLKR